MKFGLIFFLICSIIVIKIFGWTLGLLILIPAGILCFIIFSVIGGIGGFIDDRVDHHHQRKNYFENNFRKRESETNEHEEYVEYEYKDEDN
jgi:hypothetical protein